MGAEAMIRSGSDRAGTPEGVVEATELRTPNRATTSLFAVATFLGAFLLFLVQPLIAKFILPWFGGGPAVWTGCMLFFQVVLLAGYAYAHVGTRRMTPRGHTVLHVVLLAAAVWLLGMFVLHGPREPPPLPSGSEMAPLGQMLVLLAVAVGAPALVLSATSPLLNAWYARQAPGAGARVYRLYAVSNAGSLLALVAYPFVVEPALSRRTQLGAWAVAFVTFALLCAYCASRVARAKRADVPPEPAEGNVSRTTNAGARLLWLVLPACASVLLLATTNTMTHLVAPLPLLWVLPLALYLLSFILAFDARRWYRRTIAGLPLAVAAAGVCWVLLGAGGAAMAPRVVVLAGALFVCCMVCHGELAELKPPPRELTAYYLTVAAGGALGGVLVAVVAPLVLDRYLELHLALWVCCLLALAAPFVSGQAQRRPSAVVVMPSVVGLIALGAVLWAVRDPHPVGAGVPVGRFRDFYGVITLYEQFGDDPERANLALRHAGVTHGRQFLSPEKRRRPTSYYSERGGAGVALGDATARPGGRRVGVVGLGAGVIAVYGRPGDTFRFYELSPTVERIARERFTFLSDSAARCEVVIGDGRLSLEREPPQAFDVLALDAFSGHAIPYHLLTAEAFALYRRHLAPGGVVLVNVSNTYVDIQPVVAQQAARGGWTAVLVSNHQGDATDGVEAADWVLLTDDPAKVTAFRGGGRLPLREDPDLPLWTDDYASLYHVLRF